MTVASVAENCRRVVDRICAAAVRSHRDPSSIQLLAVTKTVPVEAIRAAFESGIREIGENRLQEAITKKQALQDLPLRWHFIGHVQTNKAKKIVDLFDIVQSVDRIEVAEKLDHYAARAMPVLVEVELGNEESKSGIRETELSGLVEYVKSRNRLELRGLMAIPPYSENPEHSRPFFARLRSLAESFHLTELSMGMSHDFEIAIEEGATMVRVGTALFGERH